MAAASMTDEYLIKVLEKKGLLSPGQVAHIQESYKSELKKLRRRAKRRSDVAGVKVEEASPIDVLTHYSFPVTGLDEKVLTE
ncbi:MAG: hypothetical protein V3V52_09735, partial [Candidatus Adiutricales bacterium]